MAVGGGALGFVEGPSAQQDTVYADACRVVEHPAMKRCRCLVGRVAGVRYRVRVVVGKRQVENMERCKNEADCCCVSVSVMCFVAVPAGLASRWSTSPASWCAWTARSTLTLPSHLPSAAAAPAA